MKFCAGESSLDNAPLTGRPVEVDSDKIKTLIENNQHYISREKANILKLSKSIVIGENEKCIFYFMEKNMEFLVNSIM